jgi:tRNA threonylcarbamoyladenosine biosynthesis protein TsaB
MQPTWSSVALATAKGLAFAGDVPIVGVSTLEAYAATLLDGWRAPDAPAVTPAVGAHLVPCLDARKGEVYASIFAVREPSWSDADPLLARLAPDAAHAPGPFGDSLRALVAASHPLFLLGDGAERYRAEIVEALGARAVALASARHHPSGTAVARLGAGVLAASGPHELASLVPSYARASEAEVSRARRDAGGEQR